MVKIRKLEMAIIFTLLLHGSLYLYLDKVIFAPASSFEVSANTDEEKIVDGKAYFSKDKKYMAVIKDENVEIYSMPNKNLQRLMSIKDKRVSYFKWLEDRNLAIMALCSNDNKGQATVDLIQVNPLIKNNDLATSIEKLPKDSKIIDVAYSTATNVIYMQVEITNVDNKIAYRVYRTDANHDLKRVYLTTTNIKRISIFYDQDTMIYDDLDDKNVIARHGDGSWQIISPYAGNYRLIGVDSKHNIVIAKVNKAGLAESVLKGQVKKKFEVIKTYETPVDVSYLKVSEFVSDSKKI